MADQLKEISNGTYGIGALSNGVPIASTDANTQYVVKDIHVQDNSLNDVDAALDFVVNGINVADIGGSVSGSEIIDVSSTAVAQATANFQSLVFENWMPTNQANSRLNTKTDRLVNDVVSLAGSVVQSDQIATAPNNTSNIVSWAFIGGNFYYWTFEGNITAALYRRAGGINGAQTTIASISSYMPVVFDGVDKFHWVTTTQVFTHNATTNTNTAVNLNTSGVSWPAVLDSWPRISFANGLVFWAQSQVNAFWAINPTTGHMSYITGPIATVTNVAKEVYHTDGTYYFLETTDTAGAATGNITVRTISDSVIGPLTTANTTGSATFVGTSTGAYTPEVTLNNHWPKMTPNGEFVFMSSETSGSVYVYKRFNVVTQTFAPPFTIDVSTITPNTSSPSRAPFRTLSVSDDSANKLNTTFYPQSATIRVTGVETTL